MKLTEFDYELPAELIAQEPLVRRDASRLLVVDRPKNNWFDSEFMALSDHLQAGDVLVLNNTRVFPARLSGHRDPTGGRVEVLLVQELDKLLWQALVRPGHRLKQGSRIRFDARLNAEVAKVLDQGMRILRFECAQPLDVVLNEIGDTPLPPYIKRPAGSTAADRERYQTIYASSSGAVAAPTAGLHFTEEVLKQLSDRGIQTAEITLHVGYGTFEPVHVQEISEHRVGAEMFEIGEPVADLLNEARAKRRRIVAVGTTTTRALESSVNNQGKITAGKRSTELTITPGFNFQVVNALITNFHLPRSSLLLLVSAFAGPQLVLNAYRHAVQKHYRFYSYGDCMLIL